MHLKDMDAREINRICLYHVQNAAEYFFSTLPNYKDEQIKVVIADMSKYVNVLDE